MSRSTCEDVPLRIEIFAVIYYGLIILTILNLFISSVPSVRQPLQKHVLVRSADVIVSKLEYLDSLNGTMKKLLSTEPPDIIVTLDFICLIFFTTEFVFRLFVSLSRWRYLKSWQTLLEVFYLVPAWTKLLIDLITPFFWQQGWNNAIFLLILDAMVVLRVFRIFSLFRHYRGLWVLILAIKASVRELMLLVLFVSISLTIFSILLFYTEQYSVNQPTRSNTIDSVLCGLWWAIVTLTTVGYGDIYPVTIGGRIIACLCAVTGLLIMSMVIPIITKNLHLYYGFRHAGNDVCHNRKPAFVPPESENPLPNIVLESFVPVERRLSLKRSSMSESDHLVRLKKVYATSSYI